MVIGICACYCVLSRVYCMECMYVYRQIYRSMYMYKYVHVYVFHFKILCEYQGPTIYDPCEYQKETICIIKCTLVT